METALQMQSASNDKDETIALLTQAVLAMQTQMATMETFIKRRFDEISMEINATSQQIDMSEEGMAKRFGEILGVMNAISYEGDGSTPANTGVELEAVIAETTRAANQILDASDKMGALLYDESDENWADPAKRELILNTLRDHVQTIMVSCSFQDITSQRIRKTLESLNDIEDRISDTLESMGIDVPAHPAQQTQDHLVKGSSQEDIDALFS